MHAYTFIVQSVNGTRDRYVVIAASAITARRYVRAVHNAGAFFERSFRVRSITLKSKRIASPQIVKHTSLP